MEGEGKGDKKKKENSFFQQRRKKSALHFRWLSIR